MIKIMFVCHGNICRSPMAEFIFKKLADEKGLSDSFSVCSSATSSEEIHNGIGNPIYPPAREELTKHGVPYTDKRASRLQQSDYNNFDLFIGMDNYNIRDMLRILGNDPDKKIHKLTEYSGYDKDISDPWYSGRFDIAYRDIRNGCAGLLKNLSASLANQ